MTRYIEPSVPVFRNSVKALWTSISIDFFPVVLQLGLIPNSRKTLRQASFIPGLAFPNGDDFPAH
jgi:hypothetical protein